MPKKKTSTLLSLFSPKKYQLFVISQLQFDPLKKKKKNLPPSQSPLRTWPNKRPSQTRPTFEIFLHPPGEIRRKTNQTRPQFRN